MATEVSNGNIFGNKCEIWFLMILETMLYFMIGLQLSPKRSPNGLLFTPKVVSNGDFFGLPISCHPCILLA